MTWIGVIALLGASVASTPLHAETGALSGQARAEAAGRGLLGSPAPRMSLKTIDGRSIDLGKLYGKRAIYLKFWETWCQPCREQMPQFERTYQTAGDDLVVIAVDTGINDPLEDIQKFRRIAGLTMPIVIDDGRLAAAFNLRVTPQHIVIGRDGLIKYVGHLADERLEAALRIARAPSAGAPPFKVATPEVLAPARIGDRLPDLSARTLDGSLFHTRDPEDKRPTVLVFFLPSCEWYLAATRPEVATRCRQVREQVDSLAKGNASIRWLAVASGLWATQTELSDYRTQKKTLIPLTLDESGLWFHSFGVLNVPTVILADAQGRLVRRIDGFDAQWPAALAGLAKN